MAKKDDAVTIDTLERMRESQFRALKKKRQYLAETEVELKQLTEAKYARRFAQDIEAIRNHLNTLYVIAENEYIRIITHPLFVESNSTQKMYLGIYAIIIAIRSYGSEDENKNLFTPYIINLTKPESIRLHHPYSIPDNEQNNHTHRLGYGNLLPSIMDLIHSNEYFAIYNATVTYMQGVTEEEYLRWLNTPAVVTL
jgi:hypothetical protein